MQTTATGRRRRRELRSDGRPARNRMQTMKALYRSWLVVGVSLGTALSAGGRLRSARWAIDERQGDQFRRPQMLWCWRYRQTDSVRVCSPSSRRVAPLRPRYRGAHGLDGGSAHARPDRLRVRRCPILTPTCCGRRRAQSNALSPLVDNENGRPCRSAVRGARWC